MGKRLSALAIDQVQALPAPVEIFVIVIAIALSALGLSSILAAIFKKLTVRRAAAAVASAVVAIALGGWYLAAKQADEFHPDWAHDQEVGGSSESLSVVAVKQSSMLIGENEGFFSGACAVDAAADGAPVYSSSWLSGRGRGTDEIIALRLAQPAVLTRVEVVTGWFGTRENYDNTGQPQRLLIFTDSGQVASFPVNDKSTYESGPTPVVLDFGDDPLTASTDVFIQVTRIEGDARAYSAIADIELFGMSASTPAGGGVIDVDSLAQSMETAPPCAASQ